MIQVLFHVENVNSVYWTLGFELVFYVVAVCLYKLKAFSKHYPFVLWGVCNFIILYCANHGIIKQYHFGAYYSFWLLIAWLLFSFSPLFIFGIYLYRIYKYGSNNKSIAILVFMFFGYVVFYPTPGGDDAMLTKITVSILFLLAFYAVKSPANKWLSNKFLTFSGKISYSWYLTHYVMGMGLLKVLGKYLNYQFSIFLIFWFSMFFAWLFWKFLESPLHYFFLNKLMGIRDRHEEKIHPPQSL